MLIFQPPQIPKRMGNTAFLCSVSSFILLFVTGNVQINSRRAKKQNVLKQMHIMNILKVLMKWVICVVFGLSFGLDAVWLQMWNLEIFKDPIVYFVVLEFWTVSYLGVLSVSRRWCKHKSVFICHSVASSLMGQNLATLYGYVLIIRIINELIKMINLNLRLFFYVRLIPSTPEISVYSLVHSMKVCDICSFSSCLCCLK